MKVSIGIIIVHFGDKKHTFECLKSINKVLKPNLQITIYLIDNDNKHRILKDELKQFHLKIILIKNNNNLGFAGGVNIGAKEALKKKSDFIMLLNNDTVVNKNIFNKLLPFFQNKNIKLVSPVITYYDNPDIVWCGGGILNKSFLFSRYLYMNAKINSIILKTYQEADFGAACLLIESTVFKKIGFFDERYFLNVEDIEWCFRARKAGFKLIYAPYPLVLHKVSTNTGIQGTNILTSENAYYYARNFFILLRDHKDSFNLFTGFLGQTFIRLPYFILFRTNSFKSVVSYITGYISGLYYLFNGKTLHSKL